MTTEARSELIIDFSGPGAGSVRHASNRPADPTQTESEPPKLIQTVDSKGRISLDRVKNKAEFYKITECPDGTLILTPAVVMTMDELKAMQDYLIGHDRR